MKKNALFSIHIFTLRVTIVVCFLLLEGAKKRFHKLQREEEKIPGGRPKIAAHLIKSNKMQKCMKWNGQKPYGWFEGRWLCARQSSRTFQALTVNAVMPSFPDKTRNAEIHTRTARPSWFRYSCSCVCVFVCVWGVLLYIIFGFVWAFVVAQFYYATLLQYTYTPPHQPRLLRAALLSAYLKSQFLLRRHRPVAVCHLLLLPLSPSCLASNCLSQCQSFTFKRHVLSINLHTHIYTHYICI